MKHLRFGQTLGTAHQESRRLNKADLSADVQKIEETGNVLSEIESQGFREQRASALKGTENEGDSRKGDCIICLKDTSSRKSRRKAGKKGQPEGGAVTGITGRPGVAGKPLRRKESSRPE